MSPLGFRRSVKVLPGVRVNLGKRGARVSLSGRDVTTNLSRKGVPNTHSLRGTGLSYYRTGGASGRVCILCALSMVALLVLVPLLLAGCEPAEVAAGTAGRTATVLAAERVRQVRASATPAPAIMHTATLGTGGSLVVSTARIGTALPTPTRQTSPTLAAPVLNVGFVADVTIPDDTPFGPGTPFTKTWRLKNTGAQVWPEGVVLRWVDKEQMGAPAFVPAPVAKAGESAEVSVPMVAPVALGVHRGDWQMCAGEACFGTVVYVRIVTMVESPPTATSTPQLVIPTLTPAPPPAAPVSQPRTCCKICTTGKACGDTCISRSYTCHKGPGCACNAY